MRRFMILLSLLLLVGGCSSGSDSGDVAFEHEVNVWAPVKTSVWSGEQKRSLSIASPVAQHPGLDSVCDS